MLLRPTRFPVVLENVEPLPVTPLMLAPKSPVSVVKLCADPVDASVNLLLVVPSVPAVRVPVLVVVPDPVRVLVRCSRVRLSPIVVDRVRADLGLHPVTVVPSPLRVVRMPTADRPQPSSVVEVPSAVRVMLCRNGPNVLPLRSEVVLPNEPPNLLLKSPLTPPLLKSPEK